MFATIITPSQNSLAANDLNHTHHTKNHVDGRMYSWQEANNDAEIEQRHVILKPGALSKVAKSCLLFADAHLLL